jgi:hypothetical protein
VGCFESGFQEGLYWIEQVEGQRFIGKNAAIGGMGRLALPAHFVPRPQPRMGCICIPQQSTARRS